MACLNERKVNGRRWIREKEDDKILDALRNKRWYTHSNAYHRWYLHELYEEARRRGLKLTDPI